MRIGERAIGPDEPPYVIAEIGVNHDGDVRQALDLTEAASEGGADAVKLQYFETDRLLSRSPGLAAYQKAAGEDDPVEMLGRLELSLDEMALVVERAHERGIHAIVTVFSVELVEQAAELPWDAFKTASPDVINKPLLDRLSATGKPLIVSTGASTLDEVARAGRWLAAARDRLAFLQCVSAYPAPTLALEGIPAIARAVALPTGYSDHTRSAETARDAVARGACILEKHVTSDNNARGPDHRASLPIDELRSYVDHARQGLKHRTTITGSDHPPTKEVLACERDVREVSRQSLTTTRPLSPGDVLTEGDLTIKRPGHGIAPFHLEEMVGRVVGTPIGADATLQWDHLVASEGQGRDPATSYTAA